MEKKSKTTLEEQENNSDDLSALAASINKTLSSFIRLNAGLQRVEESQKQEAEKLLDIAAAIRKLNENILVLNQSHNRSAKSLENRLSEIDKSHNIQVDESKSRKAEERLIRIPIFNRSLTLSPVFWIQIILIIMILLMQYGVYKKIDAVKAGNSFLNIIEKPNRTQSTEKTGH